MTPPQPRRVGEVEAVAWLAKDGRVIDAKAKAAGLRSGGATGSATAIYDTPLFTHPVAPGAGDALRRIPLMEHCQNGRSDICRASQRDGIICPDDVCDIDCGVREPDAQPAAPAGGVDGDAVQRALVAFYRDAEYDMDGHVLNGDDCMAAALAAARLPGGGEANLRCAKCRVGSEPGTAAYAKLYREAGTDLARCIHCGCSYGVWDEVKHDPRINAAPPTPPASAALSEETVAAMDRVRDCIERLAGSVPIADAAELYEALRRLGGVR